MAKKKPGGRLSDDSRTKQKSAGPNRGKTRPDVPSTPANKAASGKQTSNKGRAASR